MCKFLQHPRAAVSLDTQGQKLPDSWQRLVDDERGQQLQALDDLEALRSRWGTPLVRMWLDSLEDMARRRGEAS